ncbi:hypothetical protein BURK_019495 [Burkholderia sp. SJ98]|nr:hypothetical protein BURK_019495 [Burkholderia sp. SJ98]
MSSGLDHFVEDSLDTFDTDKEANLRFPSGGIMQSTQLWQHVLHNLALAFNASKKRYRILWNDIAASTFLNSCNKACCEKTIEHFISICATDPRLLRDGGNGRFPELQRCEIKISLVTIYACRL